MDTIPERSDVSPDIPGATRDRETLPAEVAALGWSPQWTTLLVRAMDGDLSAIRLWELLDSHGDADAHHVLATLGRLDYLTAHPHQTGVAS